jgi:hypothetical protein
MNALNEKLKFYETIDLERSNVLDHLKHSEKGREELRVTLLEAGEKVKEEQDKNFKYQEILINENQSLSKQILIITDMFSKKVEEYDDMKQIIGLKEKEVSSVKLDKSDLADFKAKYLRECAQREDLYTRYCQLNDQLEAQSRDNQERVESILREKQELIQENRELNKQLSDAEDEIAALKQQIEEMRCEGQRRDSEIDVERRRAQSLQNIKEHNIVLQLEVREYKQEREKMH